MKKPPSYLDAWLIAFLALMIAASIIAAHGAYVFFRYLLDPPIAALATAVTAAGIPALDAAGTLEQKRGRAALYWLGAFVFLGMETLANYFSGQAVFLANVLQAFAGKSGADLVWLAEQPAGRVLVVIYLAMPSLIVAYFAYAAASRWRSIRDARAAFANRLRRSGQLRALIVKLSRIVRELRAGLASAQADVARLSQEARESFAGHARETAELREQITQARERSAQAQAEAAKSREQLEQARELAREKIAEVAKLHEQPANEAPTRARVVAYVREQLATGRSRLDVARELGFADNTLRGWMDAEQPVNGVEVLN